MKLVRFVTEGAQPAWGRLSPDGETIQEVGGPLGEVGLEGVLDQPTATLAGQIDTAVQREHGSGDVQLLPPVQHPSKLIGVGRNYREHAAETGSEEPTSPILFGILPSAITGPRDDIHLPSTSQQIDWEGELGIVIGRAARGVQPQDAGSHIAGFVALNDISARDLQRADAQWTRAKSFDSFKPMGPCLTTPDELDLSSGLEIGVWVNGVEKQRARTDQMIFSVDFLVAYISSFCTLLPGDVISSGTPAGVGMGRTPPEYLKPGDVLETKIEGIGELVNRTIVADEPWPHANQEQSLV